MKKGIFFIFILILGLLEVTLLDSFKVFGVKPNLLLISISLAGLYFDLKWAFVLGIFAGILKDSLGANSFGINVQLFPLWIFLIIELSKKIPIDHNLIRMILIFIIGIFNSIITRLIFFVLGGFVTSLAIFLRVTFLESLYTVAILPLMFKVIKPTIYSVNQ